MARIFVDNVPYEIQDETKNLLHVCLSLGFDIPYFCWHPAFGSVGACRQCAVKQYKDEKDTRGKIVMACMTPAKDGTRISINDPEVVEFRRRIIEWLMTNHPHDCPVCDEGGECHLQDMTVMTGHVYRRFRFRKRTYVNQNLGPFINHEMNRCIQCYRCVRFYRDYAGGRDLDVFGWHNHVYFGRFEDGTLENEFSGNLVEVCPTGVFTDKILGQHYTRKWDLQTAPSICVHCSLGCNTIPGERYGILRRIRARYNGKVNGYFLCDRGRYGYEFVNSEKRIRKVLREGKPDENALQQVGEWIRSGNVIGIGSPRASLESNFALRKLVGPEKFYHGIAREQLAMTRLILEILTRGPVPSASMSEVGLADSVFILGEDITNFAPMLALALRQAALIKPIVDKALKKKIPPWQDAGVREAIQQDRGPFFIASVFKTRLDELARETFRAGPDDLARLGFAVANVIDATAPNPTGLSQGVQLQAQRIAEGLLAGQRPVIVCGTGCSSQAMIRAAGNIAWALKRKDRDVKLSFVLPECNSLAMGMMEGESIDDAMNEIKNGNVETVIVLENDLLRRMNESSLKELFEKTKHVVCIDHLMNPTTEKAQIVLPAATFAESSGTLINNEGRAQRFFSVFPPQGEVQASWRWLGELMVVSGKAAVDPWPNLDTILSALAKELPIFSDIPNAAPESSFRMQSQKIPRQPSRYSGRTAITANIDVHEPQPPKDPDSPLSFSMEGNHAEPPAALIPRFWAPRWNSVQAVNKFQIEVGGPLHGGDPGRRLIEPAKDETIEYHQKIPSVFVPRENEWLIWPMPCIFGSEELSVLSPGIAERIPSPMLILNPQDAERLGLHDGDFAELVIVDQVYKLPVRIESSGPQGIIGVSAGLPSMRGLSLPAWGKIAVATEATLGETRHD